MRPPVEANSLSSITEIAGHPPRYPRNPTEQKRQPLVLYIARVPGSQGILIFLILIFLHYPEQSPLDIILTPLKPNIKNLTANDVASSLYYLHRNDPSDELLLDTDVSRTQGNETSFKSSENQKPQLSRKPLPESSLALPPVVPIRDTDFAAPEVKPQDNRTLPNETAVQISRRNVLPPRSPVDSSSEKSEPFGDSTLEKIIPATRRPLGPRPLISSSPTMQTQQLPLPGRENIPGDKNRIFNVQPYAQAGNMPAETRYNSTGIMIDKVWPKSLYLITLIRRDPPSGAQWNIGTISNNVAATPGSPVSDRAVSLELHTTGYQQFCDPPSTTFSRHIQIEWSGSSDSASKQHIRGLSDTSHARPAGHKRSGSEILSGLHSGLGLRSNSPAKPPKPKVKGYFMTSPWNGRCEFSTGINGRSLKCKHRLPTNTNSPVSDLNSYSQDSVHISELRFNLPSRPKFKGPSILNTSHLSKPSSLIKPLSRMSVDISPTCARIPGDIISFPASANPAPTSYAALYGSDNDEDDDDDDDEGDGRLDLRLGREAAGGGNRGKRAKLGKLIIFDEGMKMLDLVIAANMGLWWEVWER
jgi:hypothetical protein